MTTDRPLLVLFCSLAIACSSGGDDSPTPPRSEDVTRVDVIRAPELAPDAVLPELDPSLASVDVFEDRLVFTYDRPGADVPAAESIVAGSQGGGYLREVMEVRPVSSTRFELLTEPAYLVDLFEDVHFRVRHEPATTTLRESGTVGGRTDALGGALSFISVSLNDYCELEVGTRVHIEATFNPIFDVESEIAPSMCPGGGAGRRCRRSETRHRAYSARIGGTLSVSVRAADVSRAGVHCIFDLPASLTPRHVVRHVVMVGPVPVLMSHTFQGTVRTEVTAEVRGDDVSFGGNVNFELSAGAAYDSTTGWRGIGTASASGDADISGTGFGVELNASGKVRPGVAYTLAVYGVPAPTVQLGPALQLDLAASACMRSRTLTGSVELEIGTDRDAVRRTSIDPLFGYRPNTVTTLYSGVIRESEEMDPSCADAGVEDGAVADPCAMHEGCEACNRAEGCGFCGASGECMSDRRRTECGDQWSDSPSSCPDCSGLTTCDQCVRNGFCGWCPGSGCLNQRSDEARACGDFQPTSCGG